MLAPYGGMRVPTSSFERLARLMRANEALPDAFVRLGLAADPLSGAA